MDRGYKPLQPGQRALFMPDGRILLSPWHKAIKPSELVGTDEFGWICQWMVEHGDVWHCPTKEDFYNHFGWVSGDICEVLDNFGACELALAIKLGGVIKQFKKLKNGK